MHDSKAACTFMISSPKTHFMDSKSKKSAGIIFILVPTVAYGGTALLSQLLNAGSGYMDNPLRQNLWRAGHAHAGVLLILSLVVLQYIDMANLSKRSKALIRWGTPSAAIFIPAAFFLSVL